MDDEDFAVAPTDLDERIAQAAASLNLVPAGDYFESENLYLSTDYSTLGDAGWMLRALSYREGLLENEPLIEGVEPEFLMRAFKEPRLEVDDPYFVRQWHMEAINAPQAWTVTKGHGVTVAVIDTGVAPLPDMVSPRLLPGKTFSEGPPVASMITGMARTSRAPSPNRRTMASASPVSLSKRTSCRSRFSVAMAWDRSSTSPRAFDGRPIRTSMSST